jgi:hypothetical protein
MFQRGTRRAATVILLVLVICIPLSAREIHVAKSGDDAASGGADTPYLTISRAAELAEPGDIVVIHRGTYRESVVPARGGTSETNRITYKAAPGHYPVVKGSEQIDSWAQVEGDVWKVEIPNDFFGSYNPYALKVEGPWLNYGQWHTRGDVYLDRRALLERKTLAEVQEKGRTWIARVTESTTTITANFGGVDPNESLAEINVRETLFMPDVTGLNYITIDGLVFKHAAPNWAPPTIELQTGAVGTRMGKGWIIENCDIAYSRCVGIILGHSPGADYGDIDSFGGHIIRNNMISHCGQAGIAGQAGATRCLIEHNQIDMINYRREFGGWETAGIKFHNSVDTTIRGNLICYVCREIQGAYGIWIDFGNQGTRISGNIIFETMAEAIFLEMNHGPCLVDNNILIGGGHRSNSENTVFAHNLFIDYPWSYNQDLDRRSRYFTPHTCEEAGRKTGVPANERWYNNIFYTMGLEGVKEAEGYLSDHNVFIRGAQPSFFEGENSIVLSDSTVLNDTDKFTFKAEMTRETYALSWTVDPELFSAERPWVDVNLIGEFPVVRQTIEDADGNPIRVDTDIHGEVREGTHPTAGPLAELRNGENTIVWEWERPE